MGTNVNEEFIKTIESSDLAAGGQLQPEQQKKFLKFVRSSPTLLSQVRFQQTNQTSGELDKLHIGEPITESAVENTEIDYTLGKKTKSTKLLFSTTKTKSWWSITWETLEENIEKGNFDDLVMEMMAMRIAQDFEELGVNGDDTIVGPTPQDKLRQINDGWNKLTDSAHIVDASSQTISKKIFREMMRRMPREYMSRPNQKWICSPTVKHDWMDLVADRETALGDSALEGRDTRPFGIPFLPVMAISDDLPITVGAVANAAQIIGNQQGPYEFTSTANQFGLDVDNDGLVEIIIPAGTVRAYDIAAAINTQYSAVEGAAYTNIARTDAEGRVEIVSTTDGVASEIDITAGAANDAVAVFGFTVAVTVGADTGGTVLDGTFMWLTDPKNFIWVIHAGTRTASEYEKDFDRWEFVIYNKVDALVEELDAVVKAIDLRIREV